MKKHVKFFLSIVTFISLFYQSSSQSTYQYAYHLNELNGGSSIVQNSENDFFITGWSKTSVFDANEDIPLIKISADGSLIWSKTINGTGDEESYAIIQTNDGGIAILGTTNSFGIGGYDVYIIKLDQSENIQWTRTIGGINDDYGYSMVQTNDQGYLIVGEYDAWSWYVGNGLVIKLNPDGNFMWARTFYDIYKLTSIIKKNDNSYIAGGDDAYGAYLVDLDTTGSPKTIKYIHDRMFNSIIPTIDKGYFFIGTIKNSGQFSYVKFDSSFNVQWARSISGTINSNQSVVHTDDNGFLLTGSIGLGIFLIKLDSMGNIVYNKIFKPLSINSGNSIIKLNNNGYAVTGITGTLTSSVRDIYLMRLDQQGNTCGEFSPGGSFNVDTIQLSDEQTSCNNINLESSFGGNFTYIEGSRTNICSANAIVENNIKYNILSIFPNPFCDKISVIVKPVSENYIKPYELKICNIFGECVDKRSISSVDMGMMTITFDTQNLPSGIYIISLHSGNFTAYLKAIKQP